MPTLPAAPSSILICWDFNGVLDTYGQNLQEILQAITDQNGHNIVVTAAPSQPVRAYLAQRHLNPFFDPVYRMDQHPGLVVRHKVAALSGHIQDTGPYHF